MDCSGFARRCWCVCAAHPAALACRHLTPVTRWPPLSPPLPASQPACRLLACTTASRPPSVVTVSASEFMGSGPSPAAAVDAFVSPVSSAMPTYRQTGAGQAGGGRYLTTGAGHDPAKWRFATGTVSCAAVVVAAAATAAAVSGAGSWRPTSPAQCTHPPLQTVWQSLRRGAGAQS